MVKGKIFIAALIVLFFAGTASAQLIPDPDVQGKIQDASQPVTLQGRIVYHELGGYHLQADLAGDKIILNQNYEVLKKFAQNRQKVTVQGKVNPLDIGARYIFIQLLNGKPYHGDKAPLVKPPTKLTPLF
jgi:hypothetical protein